ncbi:MAG: helix-turn-helix domain-containing protein [Candidatus Eremiobacteraeota bacterium]|nr:helix-turn-helix domain-containing protein [Candidatus Eremiobacteraeota bacterium]
MREAAFSEVLKEQRRAAGYSQEELAERAGLSTAAIAALEQGLRRAPYRETVRALADGLGLSESARRQFEETAAQARGRRPRRDSGIPVSLTSFIARSEVCEIGALLADHRLVTITGSGGVGKTRIAIEVARRAEPQFDETWFVDLLPVRDGSQVAAQLAARLGVPVDGDDGLASILEQLRSRRALLAIDNCEHLVGEAAFVVETLLRGCPMVTFLTTSRETLALPGELAFRLPTMDARTGSELFAARAREADPKWSPDEERLAFVSAICKDLDGIPLAIELAACRVATLGLEVLRARLKGGVALAGTRGIETRHQTMAATIAWSYDLLSETEKVLFRRLAVFMGGLRLEAAEEICTDGWLGIDSIAVTLSQLTAKSLINVEHIGTSTRYRFLEPIRVFAWERLQESGELEATMQRFIEWLKRRASRLEHDRSMLAADEGVELDNARFAVRWAQSTGHYGTILAAAQIVIGYALVWYANKRQDEKRFLTLGLLDHLDERESPEIVGLLIEKVAPVISSAEILPLGRQAIPLLKQTGHPDGAAHIHVLCALAECDRGNARAAKEHLAQAESLLNASELRRTSSGIRAGLQGAFVCTCLHDFAGARSWLEQVEMPPGDPLELEVRIVQAEIEFRDGHVEKAIELSKTSVELLGGQHIDANRQAIVVYGNLAHYLLSREDDRASEEALRKSLTLLVTADDYTFRYIAGNFAQNAAVFAARSGRAELAARLLGSCEGAEGLSDRRPEDDSMFERLAAAAIGPQLSRERVAMLRRRGAAEDLYELLEEFLADPAIAVAP